MRSDDHRDPGVDRHTDQVQHAVPGEEDRQLADLAQRLRCEAQQLASVYPPKSADLKVLSVAAGALRVESASSWGSRWLGVCAALVIVVGLVGIYRTFSSGSVEDAAVTSSSDWVAAETKAVGGQAGLAESDRAERADRTTIERVADMANEQRVFSPLMFVSELSDPELEAWLDLHPGQPGERIAF